ncbi:UDP-N-acetylmuramoyl-L-alanyl-D-glutamate--2,6-diaminopimelate ligase [Nesterenkonia aerolata]|uniref:UDP-N-acetylmuramyl-tripeptide synthetase n=1 Tax=Nesterenkonia aerolata TaxID=3074079 RepID=A0ABU2DPU2_9MICC|nr:UDP-N-acetylmuramoyl-L-alanyl-D-glutamate--2,6-diaminopimelate ligase [Nesterenkonia sp. LY-0111]MDR8018473.1 UDP-N-acetylmuramoyl-L-alanyl-D-glutamate--2,6-diaminopimelate ligase [Nesterenkonia sp. LY-0111]
MTDSDATPDDVRLSVAEQDSVFRPAAVTGGALEDLAGVLQSAGYDPLVTPVGRASLQTRLTGAAMNPQAVGEGDLFVAVSGARFHGADFAAAAAEAGAAAVLTDAQGAVRVRENVGYRLPVIEVEAVREAAGPAAAFIYGNTSESGPALFGVTGTNGKTTTTYFLRSLLDELMRSCELTTGLIGTIEIRAGSETIPSQLTTPEAVQLHSLMALFRERHVGAAAMEVSSHAISYRRTAGLHYDVAGFTNLTQDHLDLHGSMEDYFRAKAELFTRSRTRTSVITVDDTWGHQMAHAATGRVVTLATSGQPTEVDWEVTEVAPEGLGHAFTLHHRHSGERIRTRTGLPGLFNVSNAALAAVMVLESEALRPRRDEVIHALESADPFTISVPGRMQVIATAPAAIVDFAHNPDAMIRTLEAAGQTRGEGRIILVVGAAGDRDRSKRPTMGAIAVRMADHVIISDDDPHSEDPARIRDEVMQGAREAVDSGRLSTDLEEVVPRADAIRRAVEVAGAQDTIILAGRGHEVHQDFDGAHHAIDDRVELRRALDEAGFEVLPVEDRTASEEDQS